MGDCRGRDQAQNVTPRAVGQRCVVRVSMHFRKIVLDAVWGPGVRDKKRDREMVCWLPGRGEVQPGARSWWREQRRGPGGRRSTCRGLRRGRGERGNPESCPVGPDGSAPNPAHGHAGTRARGRGADRRAGRVCMCVWRGT